MKGRRDDSSTLPYGTPAEFDWLADKDIVLPEGEQGKPWCLAKGFCVRWVRYVAVRGGACEGQESGC